MKYTFDLENHVHTVDGKPLIGTSRVSNILAKPLTWWAAGEALKTIGWSPITDKTTKRRIPEETRLPAAAEALGRITTLTAAEWLKTLDLAYYAHDRVKKDKAKSGTDLHKILETYIQTGEIGDKRIQPFVDWAKADVKRWLFSEAHCFSAIYWVGGIADACAELNDGKICLVDFKSSKEAYLSQFFQCCGYVLQIEENGWFDAGGKKLGELAKPIDLVAVIPFGADEIRPWTYWDMEGGKKAFLAEVLLYKMTNV